MISVCCCAYNSKWETEIFIEGLHRHNPDVEFEVVVTHDDRANDGSVKKFNQLSRKYKNVKIVRHSPEQTIQYFEAALDYYEKKNLLTPYIRNGFRKNLKRYKKDKLVDRTKGFLWQSSGILYNKAVKHSSGDIIIVTPGDFFYLFGLKELEKYVQQHQKNGLFYASPPALRPRITNKPYEYVKKKLEQIRSGEIPYLKAHFNRDYLECPPRLDRTYLPDYFTGNIVSLDRPDFTRLASRFCRTAFSDKNPYSNAEMRRNPHYHGFHLMTRKTYRTIGGFTEEWVHRAYADDKMTYHGKRIDPYVILPPQFSVSVDRPFEIVPCGDPPYASNWKELAHLVDPLFDEHPIPSGEKRTYLYSNLATTKEITRMVLKDLPVTAPPVRF